MGMAVGAATAVVPKGGNTSSMSGCEHGAPPAPPTFVPPGQVGRTRDRIPPGWSNGNHKGFQPVSLTQGADGYTLTAAAPQAGSGTGGASQAAEAGKGKGHGKKD